MFFWRRMTKIIQLRIYRAVSALKQSAFPRNTSTSSTVIQVKTIWTNFIMIWIKRNSEFVQLLIRIRQWWSWLKNIIKVMKWRQSAAHAKKSSIQSYPRRDIAVTLPADISVLSVSHVIYSRNVEHKIMIFLFRVSSTTAVHMICI